MTQTPSVNEQPPDGTPEEGFRTLWPPIRAEDEGRRADDYLASRYQFFSREGWQKRIKRALVLINGQPFKAAKRLRPGDLFTMWHSVDNEPEVDDRVEVLYEEQGVLGLYKPGNLPIHENGLYRTRHFTGIMQARYGDNFHPVHRLDLETSGIVMCAGTPELRRVLSEQFAERGVEKRYLAIARGNPARETWTVDAPIGDLVDTVIRIKKWVVPGGQPSRTDFRVLGRKGDTVLLEARPLTGRTNQIRIHAAWCGLTLVGEKLYHADEQVFLDYFAHGNTPSVIERAGFRRLCLHAAFVAFEHPLTEKRVEVESPMPEDMREFWDLAE